MLKQRLLHPEILYALASAGHGSKILITDGNYPASTKEGVSAETVYLNLLPGMVKVTDVLEAILTAVEIEEAFVMCPDSGEEPEIFKDFRKLLPHINLIKLNRFDFYDYASSSETCLQIVTGDQRLYANILLTIGVVKP
ncbi:MAG TPA: RbsD/FucU family protein [Candidatus Hydrogenedens sp.]|nr:RbsD/FucU family protein [Candidatus Hydrogenedens sp.]HOL19016.1 RbsD/FucU family protein [Candidatus Hydrogenedens sp.]HPP57802.1 RbsD/FucU family protein [Candidatus Hydrogenedens sp.]